MAELAATATPSCLLACAVCSCLSVVTGVFVAQFCGHPELYDYTVRLVPMCRYDGTRWVLH